MSGSVCGSSGVRIDPPEITGVVAVLALVVAFGPLLAAGIDHVLFIPPTTVSNSPTGPPPQESVAPPGQRRLGAPTDSPPHTRPPRR